MSVAFPRPGFSDGEASFKPVFYGRQAVILSLNRVGTRDGAVDPNPSDTFLLCGIWASAIWPSGSPKNILS